MTIRLESTWPCITNLVHLWAQWPKTERQAAAYAQKEMAYFTLRSAYFFHILKSEFITKNCTHSPHGFCQDMTLISERNEHANQKQFESETVKNQGLCKTAICRCITEMMRVSANLSCYYGMVNILWIDF